jgi:hopanoid biosynthesis associated RND transporter like protein HpnN
VAQLGIIAGGGMLIAFACTLTFLPAMLCLCRPKAAPKHDTTDFFRRMDRGVQRHHWWVLGLFAVLAAAGGISAAHIRFDGDPLHTKNQNSEAIRTLYDLMAEPITNPYTLEALLPSLDAAQAAGAKFSKLGQTQDVLTLDSFVPDHQAEKLAAVRDAAALLLPTLTPPPKLPPVTPAALRQAALNLATGLDGVSGKLKPGDPLKLIEADAHQLATGPDAALLAANDALTRFLPAQLDRLRLALSTQGVSLADVPAQLKAEWVLPDGRARVQALPTSAVRNGKIMRNWVKAALKVVPESAGSAVWILKSADTITSAFQIAAYSALGVIAIILALSLRRAMDVALVMTPLLISGLLTALLLKISGMSLNFANIIALPLLLGVGVSFNIYFVMNWRAGVTRFLGSATARAVLFSALTTSTAFGSLALSRHPGTASMGVLLLMSLGSTVATTMILVPALLATVPRPRVPLAGVGK